LDRTLVSQCVLCSWPLIRSAYPLLSLTSSAQRTARRCPYRCAAGVQACCGAGGAALRWGYMAVASGQADVVVVAGVEHMTHAPGKEVTERWAGGQAGREAPVNTCLQ